MVTYFQQNSYVINKDSALYEYFFNQQILLKLKMIVFKIFYVEKQLIIFRIPSYKTLKKDIKKTVQKLIQTVVLL
ncbi:hypothetical protein SAMN05444387_3124 [Flavobacterium pectinovorum]|uniref:Uncharacterized protein n=1 Tax=Flavobacterium pectinovorum TaxID=29533 RepID=A0AB36P5F6_9FLAO|nr:hypothetical protein B0A72_02090 [Flavobacterium pectinovorum]SHM76181.1 hypothetical protein SAMN05444387_3124 [Flavobacterium pectinovorum]